MATRTVESTIINNTTGQRKVMQARQEVDKTQNTVTVLNVFNTLITIGGIFNIAMGIASATFGGAINIAGNFYEKMEDFYSKVYEDMTQNEKEDGGQSGKYIYSVTITYKFITVNGAEKLNGLPTAVYHWKNKPGIAKPEKNTLA